MIDASMLEGKGTNQTVPRGAADSASVEQWLDWFKDPLVLEVFFFSLVTCVILYFLVSFRAKLNALRGRKQLRSYLEGVEACLAGDFEKARELLHPVVEADPENTAARLTLGDALFELDSPSEAHRQHMEAKQVFDAEGPLVHLALARDLRAAGSWPEAVEHIDLALEESPKDEAILREAWSLKEEAGLFPQALEAGRVMFAKIGGSEIRRRLAATAAKAGKASLAHGRRDKARQYFRESLGFDPDNLDARKGLLILEPDKTLEAELLAVEGKGTALEDVVLPADRALVGGRGPSSFDQAARRVLALFPEAICPFCGTAWLENGSQCQSCKRETTPVYAEAEMAARVDNPDALADEIEENEAWFRLLARRMRDGDEAAIVEVLGAGNAALLGIMAVLLEEGDVNNDKGEGRLASVLVTQGTKHPNALLEARNMLKQKSRSVLEFFSPSPDIDDRLAPIFRHLGKEALPSFERLLGDATALADRGIRRLIIDYFLGLADIEVFEKLAARYSPVEIVRHLNRVPPQELAALVAAMPAGESFLRDAILLDPNLDQDEALVLALAKTGEDSVARFQDLFAQRGASRDLLAALVTMLGNEDHGAKRAELMLESFLPTTVHQLVAGFADPDACPAALIRLERLLLAAGSKAVVELIRVFGSAPSEVDDRTIQLIAALGKTAVHELELAYQQQLSLLGRIQNVVLLRGRHPRGCLIRALGLIRDCCAETALGKLLEEESDPELLSLVRETLRQKAGEGGAGS